MLSFYDAKVYIDKDWNFQTTAYSKETDRQSCLHSQALRLKQVCYIITAFEDESVKLRQKFVQRRNKAIDIEEKVEVAINILKEILFQESQNNSSVSCIPVKISYNSLLQTFPKSWNNTGLFWR